MPVPGEVRRLIAQFHENRAAYVGGPYNEPPTQIEFVAPTAAKTAPDKTTLQRQIAATDHQIDQLVDRSCVAGKGNQRHAAECLPGLATGASSGPTGCIARERRRGVHA
ncbi:hypothetical protein H5T55_03985 [Candidatus Bipolaricaulota bacterium]|nr:hypothetical protein [Candidatus Bipolaricaulota bacterium]